MGIYCIGWYFWAWCWLCLTLLYLLWGWYWQSFCHLFLSQALSCGLTSFHAPWAVPSPMTRVWAGLLTCAINTFFPSGWYWAWSKSLVGTFSNSYGVLSGRMHTMLLHLPCCTGPACLTEANLSPVIDVGVSVTPASWGSWSWALHLYIGIACLTVELELGSVLVALCPCIETKQMIVALLRSWHVLFFVAFHTTDLHVLQSGFCVERCCVMKFPEWLDICLLFKPQNSSSKGESSWNIQN